MIKTIYPGKINGSITATPSKSLTQRAIAAGLLASGTTIIRNPSFCDDSVAALKMAQMLGASVSLAENSINITGSTIISDHQILHCGESGLAMRMFSPVATLLTETVTFTGDGSLLKRPVTMITAALEKMGVKTESNNGFLPFTLSGHLQGGNYRIDGSSGSQLLTGLLMTLPLVGSDSEIYVDNLKSKPYISLTIKLLDDFGIHIENHDFRYFYIPGRQKYMSREYYVEGDWSGSAFLLVAGAIAGEVEIKNLSVESRQADVAILTALKSAGAEIVSDGNKIASKCSVLNSFSFDATESPDLFPPLAALAAFCNGTSRISGVSRLEHKESNRTLTIMQVLEKLGIKAYVSNDDLLVTGSEVHGETVSSHNDHRIAMMADVIALKSKGNVIISEAEAVTKSYPDFYDHMKQLGVIIR